MQRSDSEGYQQEKDPLRHLEIVMVGTKFPENIGMAARACVNMGCGKLTLAAPFWWDKEKARPLATAKGERLLDAIEVKASLEDALSQTVLAVGTTARTGGWRRNLLSPDQIAEELAPLLAEGNPVALVFGREDSGLDNSEIECCHRLVTIPTAGAASLNVAQAILLLAYECRKAVNRILPDLVHHCDPGPQSRRITHEEQERLYAAIRDTLLAIDFLKPDNPEYFLMPLRRFMGKSGIRRHEMDMLMGICRQVNHLLKAR